MAQFSMKDDNRVGGSLRQRSEVVMDQRLESGMLHIPRDYLLKPGSFSMVALLSFLGSLLIKHFGSMQLPGPLRGNARLPLGLSWLLSLRHGGQPCF